MIVILRDGEQDEIILDIDLNQVWEIGIITLYNKYYNFHTIDKEGRAIYNVAKILDASNRVWG